jgi:iron complex outermembrane receptor protein
LVLSPDTMISARAQYDFDWIETGLQLKYMGKRWIDDMNTASMPGSTSVDFDARMPVTWWGLHNTYLQFNLYNLSNQRVPTKVSSVTNATNVVVGSTTVFAKPYFYTYNAPRSLSVTLHAEF